MRDRTGTRQGNVLILVLFFSIVFLAGLFAYWFVVSSERQDTVSLVKDVQATAIGDGVAAELVSMVNCSRWEDRFYWALGQKAAAAGTPGTQVSEYYFTHAGFPFNRQGPEYAKGDVSFVGVIKDLDAFAKTYRIYVEVTYMKHRVTMSWDKDFAEGLVGSLNHDGTAFSKDLEMDQQVGIDVTDRLLDQIKAIARDPARYELTPEQAKLLGELYAARGTFNQSVSLPASSVRLSDASATRTRYTTVPASGMGPTVTPAPPGW